MSRRWPINTEDDEDEDGVVRRAPADNETTEIDEEGEEEYGEEETDSEEDNPDEEDQFITTEEGDVYEIVVNTNGDQEDDDEDDSHGLEVHIVHDGDGGSDAGDENVVELTIDSDEEVHIVYEQNEDDSESDDEDDEELDATYNEGGTLDTLYTVEDSQIGSGLPREPLRVLVHNHPTCKLEYYKLPAGMHSENIPDQTLHNTGHFEECTICYTPTYKKHSSSCYLECLHWFHFDCLKNWSQQTACCPVCRREFDTILKLK